MSDTVVLFTSRDTQTDLCTTGVHRRCWLQQKINVFGLLGACWPSHTNLFVSYLFLAFYFNFFHRKMSELRDRKKEMSSKRNFEHCTRIIFSHCLWQLPCCTLEATVCIWIPMPHTLALFVCPSLAGVSFLLAVFQKQDNCVRQIPFVY